MEDIYTRTSMLVGDEAVEKLKGSKVAVFGCGGVGSYTVEALARAGIGAITVIDSDVVAPSNVNRQIIATASTVGMPKAEVQKNRILDINPDCKAEAVVSFYGPENADAFDLSSFDYVCDAIDSVTSKLILVERCKAADVPIISSMGTGNKLHPELFEITDISKTSVCPLARVMRRELKARGINRLKVLYSKETPITPTERIPQENGRRSTPASISFVPSVAGLLIAGEVIRDLIG